MRAVPLVLVALLAAGCFGGNGNDDGGRTADCADPPCDPVWPAELKGPFTMQAGMPESVIVPSHDGTELAGWLYLPQLPEGLKAPTVLVSSPYYGLDQEPPGSDAGGAGDTARYVENGYAVAAFSVRGTGVSGGCFQNKGLEEQMDQAVLVEWVAAQPWSSGRVAMAGTSYPGTTPFMAALQQAPHLTTILINGPVTDPYTELHTPQGALYTMGGPYEAGRRGLVTGAPLGGLGSGDGLLPRIAQVGPERLCPELVQVLAGAEAGHFTDDRNGAFWQERQIVMGFPAIDVPVFLSHGLQETAHPYQEDIAWQALSNAPKRFLLGQWDHEFPRVEDWQGMMLEWLEYWMKDVGESAATSAASSGRNTAPGLGVVTYQDEDGVWHNTTAWPPPEARSEALYLAAGKLSTEAADGGTFQSVPPPPRQQADAPREQLCGRAIPGTGLVFRSEPFAADTLVAGNPMAKLRLTSDQPGGIVALHLAAEPPAGCDASRLLSSGVADLRFHQGGFTGTPFPTTSTDVRIDLLNLAAVVHAGERLALIVSYGDTFSTGEVADPITDARFSRSGQPYVPFLDVQEGSHIVLPLIGGSLGGFEPFDNYPPRPFTPLQEE